MNKDLQVAIGDFLGADATDTTEGKVASGLNTGLSAIKSIYDTSKKKPDAPADTGKDKDKKKPEDDDSGGGSFFTAYHGGLPTYAWMGIGVGGIAILYMIIKGMKK